MSGHKSERHSESQSESQSKRKKSLQVFLNKFFKFIYQEESECVLFLKTSVSWKSIETLAGISSAVTASAEIASADVASAGISSSVVAAS